jgi:hypothetical protein
MSVGVGRAMEIPCEGAERDVRNSYDSLEIESSLTKQGMGMRANCAKPCLVSLAASDLRSDVLM